MPVEGFRLSSRDQESDIPGIDNELLYKRLTTFRELLERSARSSNGCRFGCGFSGVGIGGGLWGVVGKELGGRSVLRRRDRDRKPERVPQTLGGNTGKSRVARPRRRLARRVPWCCVQFSTRDPTVSSRLAPQHAVISQLSLT